MMRRLLPMVLAAMVALGKRESGHLSTHENWKLLDKFCFSAVGSHSGEIELKIKSSTGLPQNLIVLLYDDQRSSWPKVWPSKVSCPERQKYARATLGGEKTGGSHSLTVGTSISESIRPRWWYVVVSTCGTVADLRPELEIEYDLWFTNSGGWLDREFSWDQQGLIQLYSVSFILTTAWLALYLANLHQAHHSARRLHSAPYVVGAMHGFLSFSFGASLVHYSVYGSNGTGVVTARILGAITHVIFQLGIVVFAIAMAKSWSISNEGLRKDPKFSLLIGTLVAVECLAYFWHWFIQDPAAFTYIFNTPPGLVVVVLRMVALVWFGVELHGIMQYYAAESAGKRYYILLGIIFTTWLVSFVVFVVVAHFLSPWVKKKVLTFVVVIADMITSVAIGWCSWPRWIEMNMDASGHIRGQDHILGPGSPSAEMAGLLPYSSVGLNSPI